MAYVQSLVCDDEERRALVQAHASLNGIDYIEVVTAPPADNQLLLEVHFIVKSTPAGQASLETLLDALDGATAQVSVQGGVRVRHVKVTAVTRAANHLVVRVSEPGDFSTYTLAIDSSALDRAYAQCDFSFKAGCPSRFDCRPQTVCPPEPHADPLIDYMAKDYASYRQALLDLIPMLAPHWQERHAADLGITLVELLAYVGDQLSYYQDAVANEAYLETARQRVSVRRHARLIDYPMHDGANAHAFIHLSLAPGSSGVIPKETLVLTRISAPLGANATPPGPVIDETLAEQALNVANAAFEVIADTPVDAMLNEIPVHPWGNRQCCLPRGVTSLDLIGNLGLAVGDFLLLEEVKGPETGLAADADQAHRQVVRLTSVTHTQDLLLGLDLTQVTWDGADALTFPLCLSARLEAGAYVEGVSVARGNIVLASHGRTIRQESYPGPQPPIHPDLRRPYRLRLNYGPLTFQTPAPPANGIQPPVRRLLESDPHQTTAQVHLNVQEGATVLEGWQPAPHLLDSDAFSRHFAVEMDNDGWAILRFGDGEFGLAPHAGTTLAITYRVGNGTTGNVGAEALVHIVDPEPLPANWPAIAPVTATSPKPVRNPLPAWGGVDPEPVEQVKQRAPAAFHAEQYRAVTEEDYSRAAEKHPEVARAVAQFRWTGSWHTVFVTIDPRGRSDVPPELEQRVRAHLTRYKQAGYDLEINPPSYVPLDIEIDVCVKPDHFRGDVEEAVLVALSNQRLPAGRSGFFHPDNFTFGQPVYLSHLYATVEAVAGVDSAVVTRFKRLWEPTLFTPGQPDKATQQNLAQAYLPIHRLEIARLDNDPNFPESGVLHLNMRGGK